MTETMVDKKRFIRRSADGRIWDRVETIKALILMSYTNRPPHTSVLQGDKRVRKGNQTIKVMD